MKNKKWLPYNVEMPNGKYVDIGVLKTCGLDKFFPNVTTEEKESLKNAYICLQIATKSIIEKAMRKDCQVSKRQ